jgi:hypothetical protein
MDPSSIDFMKHMAATVMEHLDTVRSKHLNSQAKRMIFGLGSFVEGKTTLRDSWLEEEEAATGWMRELVEGQIKKSEQDLQESLRMRQLTHSPMEYVASSEDEESNKRHKVKASYRSSVSGDKLPDDTTPAALQRIFSRVANLIRESIEVEGVVFLDARIESFGGLVGYETTDERTRSSSEDSTNTASGDSASSPTRSPSECRGQSHHLPHSGLFHHPVFHRE